MAEVIRMPRMSDTMEEGNLVGWLKKVGDEVEPGDVLAEVETDKATMELESYHEGVLLYIGVKEGSVPVNGILAIIGEAGEDYKEALASAQADNPAGASAPAKETAAEPVVAATTPTTQASAPVVVHDPNERLKVSPLAKSMAEQSGINLHTVKGSGDNGRIIKRDIEAMMKGGGNVSAPASTHTAASSTTVKKAPMTTTYASAGSEEIPVSQMRKVIARRLGESKFTSPHFYLTVEINMGNAIAARKSMNEVADTKISFNDIVVKSCAMALQKHPNINSSWLGDKIRINKDINIGVAVAVPDGLMVPVIKQTNYKSLTTINYEVKQLAGKARDKKLQPDEMQGNTFTISNLGMMGVEEFTAIINPPDACILAVGGIIEKPIVVNGEIKVGKMMKVTLSCDHRIVDGAMGAEFLKTLKGILQDPVRMLI